MVLSTPNSASNNQPFMSFLNIDPCGNILLRFLILTDSFNDGASSLDMKAFTIPILFSGLEINNRHERNHIDHVQSSNCVSDTEASSSFVKEVRAKSVNSSDVATMISSLISVGLRDVICLSASTWVIARHVLNTLTVS